MAKKIVAVAEEFIQAANMDSRKALLTLMKKHTVPSLNAARESLATSNNVDVRLKKLTYCMFKELLEPSQSIREELESAEELMNNVFQSDLAIFIFGGSWEFQGCKFPGVGNSQGLGT